MAGTFRPPRGCRDRDSEDRDALLPLEKSEPDVGPRGTSCSRSPAPSLPSRWVTTYPLLLLLIRSRLSPLSPPPPGRLARGGSAFTPVETSGITSCVRFLLLFLLIPKGPGAILFILKATLLLPVVTGDNGP